MNPETLRGERMKPFRIPFLFLVIALLSSACARPFIDPCRENAQDAQGEFKYTKMQAAVACSRAHFYALPHLVNYNKETDRWELNQSGIFTSDVEEVLRNQAKSLDIILGYENQEDADWVDWFKGFREGLEKEEKIVLEILRRLSYVKTYNEFTDLTGELPQSMQQKEFSYFFPHGRKFYSMRVLYPVRNLQAVPFAAEYIEVAKRDGKLKLVDTFEVSSTQKFAKKIPNLYDPNEFSWERHDRGWLIKSYKVATDENRPADNIVHYIEVFRKRLGLKSIEESPAVRGYLVAGGSRVAVFVVDYDKEGFAGHASPDAVIRTGSDITTGRDLFADSWLREKLLDAIYDHPENNPQAKPERRRPKDRALYTAIVKMGEAKLDVWEEGSWTVPFDYKILVQKVEIGYKNSRTPEEKRLEEREKLRQIKLFQRSFLRDGKTVAIEYWLPKDEYAQQNIVKDSAFAVNETVQLRRKNGPQEVGEVGYFSKYIKVVDYLYGGKWWRIADEDGNTVFEKKREIADPTAGVGSTINTINYGNEE